MHVVIANPRWRGKRFRHSRRLRNPQFCISGKRSMGCDAWQSLLWLIFSGSPISKIELQQITRGSDIPIYIYNLRDPISSKFTLTLDINIVLQKCTLVFPEISTSLHTPLLTKLEFDLALSSIDDQRLHCVLHTTDVYSSPQNHLFVKWKAMQGREHNNRLFGRPLPRSSIGSAVTMWFSSSLF